MTYKLIKFDEISESAYMDYISEWENNNEVIVPYAARRDGMTFDAVQKRWQNDTTDAVRASGFVPSTLYFLVTEAHKAVGAIHFRHELNDHLMQHGGHIGYGVRASKRQKGIAGVMLKLMLDQLRVAEPSLKRVLLTCDDLNEASAKTIESNGGIFENKVSEQKSEGETIWVRRYWISL
ncbi:GNAT family N-acetyltransferase [Fusibacter ferrireducens]|uniref:GNAT family N-acetyltransferase n=1 Tax=Fusibacter ferrireducens TaxID=2785058 RepID=A0ABR9ZVH7_9FIRM|nr:GNAT family N-acetyltransferase [Fusibacter ferrireducens]MBF4694465.1 GNAT family N-acetyltransferase [Fusibacter ferrireducens]